MLGLARLLAGGWFIATGAATLRQYRDLLPQAERLLGPDTGTTGAPMRSLLMLVAAIALVLIGLTQAVKGFSWMRRVQPSDGRPAELDGGEVVAVLRDHRLPAFADGPATVYWPLWRWLSDEVAGIPQWRRELTSRGVRASVRSCGVAIVVTGVCLAVPAVTSGNLLGPFPTSFVILLPVVTAIWAVLGLMLIGSSSPRIESVELPLPADMPHRDLPHPTIIESRPGGVARESPALGLTLGASGVAVQCLMLWWWNLSPMDYPVRATSIIRHVSSIGGGVVFFAVGGAMLTAATTLLVVHRYQSTLVLIDAEDSGLIVRAAAVRTESLGLAGPRHVIAAVGGSYVVESAERLIREVG